MQKIFIMYHGEGAPSYIIAHIYVEGQESKIQSLKNVVDIVLSALAMSGIVENPDYRKPLMHMFITAYTVQLT